MADTGTTSATAAPTGTTSPTADAAPSSPPADAVRPEVRTLLCPEVLTSTCHACDTVGPDFWHCSQCQEFGMNPAVCHACAAVTGLCGDESMRAMCPVWLAW